MASTREFTLSSDWTAAAAGPGTATVTAADGKVSWSISTTGKPTLEYGHFAEKETDFSMDLASGETLYLRGRGFAAVTATNPLP